MAEGVRLRKAHDHTGALDLFRRAYQMGPGPKTAAQLGLCEMAVAQFVEAEAHLGEALRSTSDPWVNENRAVLYDALNSTKNFLGTTGSRRPAGRRRGRGRRAHGRPSAPAPPAAHGQRPGGLRAGHRPRLRALAAGGAHRAARADPGGDRAGSHPGRCRAAQAGPSPAPRRPAGRLPGAELQPGDGQPARACPIGRLDAGGGLAERRCRRAAGRRRRLPAGAVERARSRSSTR